MTTIPLPGNINIIGFSITGYGNDTSFGRLLERNLVAHGWPGRVREISYGGLSINALAGLIGLAAKPVRAGDIVGLELATSFYSLHRYKLEDARPLVFAIADYFAKARDARVFFLNLFRADLDDNDCVVQAIREASDLFSIPIIDFKQSFRHPSSDKPCGTTDGVHPDQASRERIAADIEHFLLTTNLTPCSDVHYGGPVYHYFDFCSLASGREVFDYEGRGKQIQAVIVPATQELVVQFEESETIEGICFLYGPETGYISLSVDDQEPMELITYDENSYYRRIGYRPVNRSGRHVNIQVLDKTRQIGLVRPSTLTVGTRRDFLCGLILKK